MAAHRGQQREPDRFLVESTLGKLAKWLRLLGFDAQYHAGARFEDAAAGAGPGRILLTRTRETARRFSHRQVVLIQENDPYDQLRRVASTLGWSAEDLKPFTRCLRCNRRTTPIPRDDVRGRVPDYVWQTAPRFTTCSHCNRIFWPGTHTERALDRIRSLFDPPAEKNR
jgi:uncharacterized protein with PIN domain